MSVVAYAGPAGIALTPDEILILWAEMCRNPTAENESIRRKLKVYLESREVAT